MNIPLSYNQHVHSSKYACAPYLHLTIRQQTYQQVCYRKICPCQLLWVWLRCVSIYLYGYTYIAFMRHTATKYSQEKCPWVTRKIVMISNFSTVEKVIMHTKNVWIWQERDSRFLSSFLFVAIRCISFLLWHVHTYIIIHTFCFHQKSRSECVLNRIFIRSFVMIEVSYEIAFLNTLHFKKISQDATWNGLQSTS